MENMHNDIRVERVITILVLLIMKMFLLFCSFMKDFKRKGSLSLIEELKTHSKFPLIGTFLETLTGSSKEVQRHDYYLVQMCFTISFPEGCANAEK